MSNETILVIMIVLFFATIIGGLHYAFIDDEPPVKKHS